MTTTMKLQERPMLSRDRISQLDDGLTLLHLTRIGHRNHRLGYHRQRSVDWMVVYRSSIETLSILDHVNSHGLGSHSNSVRRLSLMQRMLHGLDENQSQRSILVKHARRTRFERRLDSMIIG